MIFENATVEITTRRWEVVIRVHKADGTVETYIASADHGLTYGDGIWFGTPEEKKDVGW